MTAGAQPTMIGLNQSLTSLAVQLRETMMQIDNLNLQISKLGNAGLQEIGFDDPGASATLNMSALLNTPAAIYYGKAAQAVPRDFHDELAPLWAGQ